MPKQNEVKKRKTSSKKKPNNLGGLHQYWKPVVTKKEGSSSRSTPSFALPFQQFEKLKFSTPSPAPSFLPPFPTQWHLQTHYEEINSEPKDASSSFPLPMMRSKPPPLIRSNELDLPNLSTVPFSLSSTATFSSSSLPSSIPTQGYLDFPFSNHIPPPPPWHSCSSHDVYIELRTLIPCQADLIQYWYSIVPEPKDLEPQRYLDWCTAFQPTCLQEVLGQPVTLLLDVRSWLKAWYRKLLAYHFPVHSSFSSSPRPYHEKKKASFSFPTASSSKKKRKKRSLPLPGSSVPTTRTTFSMNSLPFSLNGTKDDDDDAFFLFDPTYELPVSPFLILEGPSSSGKTSLVYASAHQFGWKVFEVNASMKRSGKELDTLLGPLLDTYAVDTRKPWLVYIAQADILFDEDRGCYASLEHLALQSRCPIMIGCESSKTLPASLLQQSVLVRTHTCPVDVVMWYVQYRMYLQGTFVHRHQLMKWSRSWKHVNIKLALRQLEFWTSPALANTLIQEPNHDCSECFSPSIDVERSSSPPPTFTFVPVSSASLSTTTSSSTSFSLDVKPPSLQSDLCLSTSDHPTPSMDIDELVLQTHNLCDLDRMLRFPSTMLFELTEPELPPPSSVAGVSAWDDDMSTPPSAFASTNTTNPSNYFSSSNPFTTPSSFSNGCTPPLLPLSTTSSLSFLVSEREHLVCHEGLPLTHSPLFLFHVYLYCVSRHLPTSPPPRIPTSVYFEPPFSSFTFPSPSPSPSSSSSSSCASSLMLRVYAPFLSRYTSRHLSRESLFVTLLPFARGLVRWNVRDFERRPVSMRKTKRSQAAPYFALLSRECIEEMAKADGLR